MTGFPIASVHEAAARLEGVAHRTPVLTSTTLDARVGARVWMKAECFQRTGSFKFRGAYNAVASLSDTARVGGVVTYSSGNHGQALALAGSLLGAAVTVVMPDDAPAAKRAAVEGYGARVVAYDRYGASREEIGARIVQDTGAILIPPFDHDDVMAGQGTATLELLDVAANIDTLVVPVGGGGLIAGSATAAKHVGGIRVVGVEPETGNDAQRSLAAGSIVTIDTPRTIADGQQTTSVSERTFAVMRERVDEIVTVTDAEIRDAMVFAFERLNVVLEPSGASALAAVMAGAVGPAERVGVILSGGNIGAAGFAAIVGD
ncbi:MAG: pyridoxal-phosphate dependent enzyme [Acidimicrobiales bacterium]